ncbi:hypothetical protein SCOR_15205 [Sulfidibacter corallicola]|uniref:Uncharacterized protein n=1 Tax=Sulfidibacter corallicola TaxID=2818388 RepID=A0A8A4TYM2_SULCO|nr:hypothetical protein [Sulfidibacter corallicola]QTD54184.1 hypothetical protein J3U87_17195 [Sulfidibacter corallicola]
MPFIYTSHQSLSYGDGYLQAEGQTGQVVRLVGNDLFAVNTDPTEKSFGILIRDYKAGDMPGIYCNGGVLTTDVYEGSPAAGDELKVSSQGYLTPGPQAGEQVIGQVISADGGILKFKLLV